MKKMDVEALKKTQLEILLYVDNFCRNNNIDYFLSYGTLLGAVRHKGYIPWDDDIDICMNRENFNKFLEIFNKNNSNYRLCCFELDNNFPYEYAKIEDVSTVMIEETTCKYNLGVNIDLFIMDDLGKSKFNAYKLYLKEFLPCLIFKTKILLNKKNRPLYKRFLISFGQFITKGISVSSCIKKIIKVGTKYSGIGNWYFESCTRWINPHMIYDKEWFNNYVDVEFEGHNFKAPVEYKKLLTTLFGDYMKLPPEEERVTHHIFEAYKK